MNRAIIDTVITYGIVVHGGAGTSDDLTEGCRTAGERGIHMLEKGDSSLNAAVEAVRMLEDDGKFNAGSGSLLRIDGKSVEMDAAVMDSEGNIGAAINVRGLKNPVILAQEIMRTPHVALAGRGAEGFARKLGLTMNINISEESLRKYKIMKERLLEDRAGDLNPRWKNLDQSFIKMMMCDTVGAVAVDRRGIFAVATSTGGASPMMVGRVGDTPLIGCGFFAGPSGAVAVTGLGEEIIKRMLAKTAYDLIASNTGTEAACRKALDLFPPGIAAGIIGISAAGYAICSNTTMAHYAMIQHE